MKVLFVMNASPHYYNHVLSRLNKMCGMELCLIRPKGIGKNVGSGVYQTNAGINFKVIELEETNPFGLYFSFNGLARTLWRERPEVIVVNECYLRAFLFDIILILTRYLLGIKLVLKTIPFRLPRHDEEVERNHQNPLIARYWWLLKLWFRKVAWNIPDAFAVYIDAGIGVLGSYGVEKERIFVVRNSPNTDLMFNIRKSLEAAMPILPENPYRIVHIGRLVEWKRVDLLLEAFVKVKSLFKNAELLIIGTGPQEQRLKTLSKQLGIEADVNFLGGVYSPELLGQYLMSSSVYVLAGMGGLSINDAMCFGLPIICSVCDGTEKNLVRDGFNGEYFREGKAEDLADKIIHLLGNSEMRMRMGENSTKIIQEKVNIHTVSKGYMDAFAYVTRSSLSSLNGAES